MNLRRVALVAAMVLLAVCGLGGALAAVEGSRATLGVALEIAIGTVVAAGVAFALTFLVDRPRYRIGGLAAILTVFLLLIDFAAIEIADSLVRGFGPYLVVNTLWSMLAFTFLFGIPTVGGLLLARFRWAKFAAWTLTGFFAAALALAALACALRIILPAPPSPFPFGGGPMVRVVVVPPDPTPDHLLASSALVFGIGLAVALLLVNAGCKDRRYFRWPAILMAMVSALFFLGGIWGPSYARWASDAWGILLPALFCAHLNLLLMHRSAGAEGWVRAGTIAASLLCCILLEVATRNSDSARTLTVTGAAATAVGIFAMCGSLGMIALSLMRKRFDYQDEKVAETLTHMQIVCPRCEKGQRIALGDSACGGCGLKFSIKALEPRCAECGYLLYGITSPRCPECGAAVAGVTEPPAAGAAPAAEGVPAVEAHGAAG